MRSLKCTKGSPRIVAIASLLATACPNHSVVEGAKAPPRTASSALGPSSYGEPLIVDWQPADRSRLEVSMREGVAVVKYDGTSLTLLKDCRVAGEYGFFGTNRKEQMIRLEDADEIRANLPLSGLLLASSLQGELSRGSVLDVALVWVGQLRTTWTRIELSQLEGDCQGATHFVRGAMVGAFGMQTSSRAEAQTVAKLFAAGVEAGSHSKSELRVVEGNPSDCVQVGPDAERAPAQCSVPIRLELKELAKAAASQPEPATLSAGLPEACPNDWVQQDGKCARARPNAAHQCRIEEVADCETQCANSSAQSCLNLGYALERGLGTRPDVARAAATYKKACDAGLGLGCHDLGTLYARGLGVTADAAMAAQLYRRACDAGEPRGCNSLGAAYFVGQGVQRDLAKAAQLLRAGCNGGLGEGCANVGALLLTQGLERAKDAAGLFRRACDGQSGSGCAALAGAYEFGLGVGKDLPRAAALARRACDLGENLGCTTLASYFAAGKGMDRDDARAKTLFADTCAKREVLACAVSRVAYRSQTAVNASDIASYAATWEKTCRMGLVGDCTSLGVLYVGSGRTAEGTALLKQACTSHDEFACWIQPRL